jgi:hypothetical protein
MFIDFNNHYNDQHDQDFMDHYTFEGDKIEIVGTFVVVDGKKLLFFNRDESFWVHLPDRKGTVRDIQIK